MSVCALFSDLHDVGQVLTEQIREELGVIDVQLGPPRDAAVGTDPGVRITLLYLTPQPSHVNDPVVPGAAGMVDAPPVSLSCFYLFTTSGVDLDDPAAAHHVLGRILTMYHGLSTLDLPLTQGANGAAFTDLGDGPLHIHQVPMSLDQIDKVWTPVEVPLQPWALFEVWPVQLKTDVPTRPAAPPVHPGGIGLDVRVLGRPGITRVAPDAARAGGRIRIEVTLPGDLDAVAVDNTVANAPAVTREDDVVLLALDGALTPGSHRLTVRSGGFVSPSVSLPVYAADAPLVDALAATRHDPGADLVLAGVNLAQAQKAVFWPDRGVAGPADVHSVALQAQAANQATVASAELTVLASEPGGSGLWRCSLLVATAGAEAFTPFVLVELAS